MFIISEIKDRYIDPSLNTLKGKYDAKVLLDYHIKINQNSKNMYYGMTWSGKIKKKMFYD